MPEKPLPPHLRAKLDALGVTPRDWTRIRALVEAVTPTSAPSALWDLDSTYAVAAIKPDPRHPASDRICVMVRPDGMKVAVICWKIGEHDLRKRKG